MTRRSDKLFALAAFAIVVLPMTPVLAQGAMAARAQVKALAAACRADAERFCATTQRGGGRILACLNEHGSELSSACRDALPTAAALKAKADGAIR